MSESPSLESFCRSTPGTVALPNPVPPHSVTPVPLLPPIRLISYTTISSGQAVFVGLQPTNFQAGFLNGIPWSCP